MGLQEACIFMKQANLLAKSLRVGEGGYPISAKLTGVELFFYATRWVTKLVNRKGGVKSGLVAG